MTGTGRIRGIALLILNPYPANVDNRFKGLTLVLDFDATLRPLYPREWSLLPIVEEVEWAPGRIWTGRTAKCPTHSELLYGLYLKHT